MRRILALSLADFAVERARRLATVKSGGSGGAGSPALVVLVAVVRGAQLVEAASPEARALGVRSGMSLAHARALIGERPALMAPSDPRADQRTLVRLARWARRWSPTVAVDAAGGLLLDATGVDRLFGSELALCRRATAELSSLGFRARAAVASTIGCAWAVARFGPLRCASVPQGAESRALAQLPLESLRVEQGTVAGLAELGVTTVGQARELPRAGLPARFEGELLLRIDQALGLAFEPLIPVRTEAPPRAARELEEPVGPEVFLRIARALVEEVCEELASRAEHARELIVEIECSEAPRVAESLVLGRPSADPAHLWSLLEPRLERAPLGFGALRATVRVTDALPAAARQVTRFEAPASARPTAELGRLLDALAGRLGPQRVLGLECLETHVPEDAFRVRPLVASGGGAGDEGARVTASERPAHLFGRPESARVRCDERALPRELSWRGERLELTRCIGPERLEGPWWRGGRAARDAFRVAERGGRWLWLARDAAGAWAVHGEWC